MENGSASSTLTPTENPLESKLANVTPKEPTAARCVNPLPSWKATTVSECVLSSLKPDKVAALAGYKSTLGYGTSTAATEKTRADNKAKKLRKKEQEKAAKLESYEQHAFNEAWSAPKGKGSKGKGGSHSRQQKM